ncbi:hypothetical protein ACB092_08G056100 [Castanea dentata]
MASIFTVFFLLSIMSLTFGGSQPQQKQCNQKISPGSSLNPTTSPTFWLSFSGQFAFGFYPQGNDFMVGICLVGTDNNITVVWTANRDDSPVTSNSTLDLTMDGKLRLGPDEQGVEKLISSEATESASSACMLDNGNFVLYNNNGSIIWESFSHPTDTILGGQILSSGAQLFSSSSETNHSTERYRLKMQDDGNLVLYPVNTVDEESEAYWSSVTSSKSLKFRLYLNYSGVLEIINSTSMERVKVLGSPLADNNTNTIYRATLVVDGIFRLYSHDEDRCEVKGFCGFNSFCTLNDYKLYCPCLPGTQFVDPNLESLGCERNYSEVGCGGGHKDHIAFYMYSKRQKLPLRYVRGDTNSVAFFKVGIRSTESWNKTSSTPKKPPLHHVTTKKAKMLIIVLILAFTTFSCLVRALRYKRLKESETLVLTKGLTLNLFSYDELKRATNGFKHELGKGSFGTVYKGALYKNKNLVAVKRLEKLVEDGEREFRAKMRAIGRTRHKNLVQLLGYCVEGSKRLFVYEYVSNGSLADLIFKAKISNFGLAKLLIPDQTRTFTLIRGTRGYIAPEWQKSLPISVKADVYSYGIVFLEIVCCRKNMEVNVSGPEETALSTWVYKCFVAKELDKIMSSEEIDKRTLENMVKVGLWCIQDDPILRPSMKSVVLMLEGITDISVPPCPTNVSM